MRYALVTGGSRGIGRAICIKLAAMGYPVVINYLGNQEAAEATKSAIEQMGGTAQLLRFDISNPQAIEEAIEMWENSHPNDYIAVLVNNAGVVDDKYLLMLPEDSLERSLSINIKGYFHCAQNAALKMMRKKKGCIVNISSVSSVVAIPGQSVYSATKGAVNSMTQTMAKELAP